MGYIKKLKNNELVGGTDKTTIYPVTSAEAVFEEVSDNEFKSQKYLNNHITNERIVDNTIENRKLKDDTIDMGKLNTQLKTIIQNAYDASWKVKEEPFSLETKYDANDVVYDPDTNSSYVSLTADNQGNPVRLEDEEAVNPYWRLVINGISAVQATEEIEATKDELIDYIQENLKDQVDDEIADAESRIAASEQYAQGVIAEAEQTARSISGIVYQTVAATPNYTDTIPVQNKAVTAQIGYYTCSGGSGATIIVDDTDAAAFTPVKGGQVKILMTQKSAVTSGNVQLQFGSVAATKKVLLYNGEAVSTSNTWEEGEVISVYYDGTYYQASNAQGLDNELKETVRENSISDDLLKVVTEETTYTTDDIYVEGILWNTTINVGQVFNDETDRVEDANSAAYKVGVHAGEEVVFNAKPSGYGNYGRTLLTDINNKVLVRTDRSVISAGYTMNVTADGYLYCHFGKTVQNPFKIVVKTSYRSNKYLTEQIGKATAKNVSFNSTNTSLFSDNVQNALEEIVGSEVDVTYSYKGTGRFDLDGSINGNSYYRYTNPIPLRNGASIVVNTSVEPQYGFIALTDENGSSYTVVAANRSSNTITGGTYTATEDCFVSVSLNINYASNKIKYLYPSGVKASKVAYDNSNTPIITGTNVQTAISQLYNTIAGSFTVNYSNKGEGFVDSRTSTISSSGYFRYTNPIHLMRGDEVTVTTNMAGYITIVSKTDSEGSYFEPVVVDHASSFSTVRTYTYTASEDCYIVISHSIYYTTYKIKYLKRFIYDVLGSVDSQIKKDGGIFLTLGDSITSDAQGWEKDVSNNYGLSLVNLAVAGAVWCSFPPFRVDLSGDFTADHGLNNIENQMYRFLQKITPEGEVVPELTENMTYNSGYSYPVLGTGELDRNDIRLIGLSCGTNDNNLSYQDGDLNSICNNPDIRAIDRSTMRGVIRWACVLLQYYCPNAKIFLLTPIPTGRSTTSFALERVGNNIKTVAYKLGVNVVDMQYCGISSAVAGMTIVPNTNNESRYFADGLHPKNFGQRLMGRYVSSMLDSWWKY